MPHGGNVQWLGTLIKLKESIDSTQKRIEKCHEIYEGTIKRKWMFFDRMMNLFDDSQRTQRSQNVTYLFQETDDVEDIDEGYSENNQDRSVNLLPMLEELDLPFTENEISMEGNVKGQHSEAKYCSELKRDNNSGHIGEKDIASYVEGRKINAEPVPADNEGQCSILKSPMSASESSQLSSVEKVELKGTAIKAMANAEKATQTLYQWNEAKREMKQRRKDMKKHKRSHLQKSNTEQLNTVANVISKKPGFPADNEGQCSILKSHKSASESSQLSSVEKVELKGTAIKAMANAEKVTQKLYQWNEAKREKKQRRKEMKKQKRSHLQKSNTEQLNTVENVISKKHAADNQTGTYTFIAPYFASSIEVLSQQMPTVKDLLAERQKLFTMKDVYCVQLKLTENSNRNGFGVYNMALSIISNEKLWITIQALQEYSKLILLELHPELMFSRVDVIQKAVLASLFSLWTYLLGCKLKGGLNASAVVSFEDLYNALEVVSYRCIDSANIFPDTIRMFVHFPVLNFSGEGILVTANGHDLFQQTEPQKNSTKQRMRDSES
ncbi:uncharacterized protein LOC127853361 isoform X2 [Dreissena polymorpha]|uniref:uncharacterized protein LOC127853361 isoform X2 n=1 Tax=Dreissena polymorpha TaxID=45954 RepID=UPI002264BFAC|nr:uncharacterized protein LOC127853361 isoform X2 [Dreissena polymorpha]